MKKILASFILILAGNSNGILAQSISDYKIIHTYHIASPGGWDYLAIHNNRLYVSHGTQVNILNENTGDSIGWIPNTIGIHGIAFDAKRGRGYTSNGRSNNVTVFSLVTNDSIQRINTGENPDAILYDPFSDQIITCNGRAKNLSLIDAGTNTVVATIDVGGKPETAVSDEKGKIFVNIEDKNEIVVADLKTRQVTARWPLNGDGPTGLSIDRETHRLFAGCERKLVILNSETGKLVDTLTIGGGCDGVAFDSKRKLIYTSNGEGTVSVIHEISPDKFSFIGNIITKRGARTIALDESVGRIFLPTADFDTVPGPNGRPRMLPGTFQVLVIQGPN